MSNTPETDANQIFLGFNPDEGDYFVPATVARKLEQQRDSLAEELNELKEEYGTWWAQKRIAIDELKDVTEQRDRLAEAMIPAMTRAYTRGYNHGHADTVESAFMIVHANDELEVFADDILQMLLDGSQPEAQSALAAVKGGSDEEIPRN
jgi:DNA repair exonuclease SbcCD ATPase subunit